jgi:hypothetical protein
MMITFRSWFNVSAISHEFEIETNLSLELLDRAHCNIRQLHLLQNLPNYPDLGFVRCNDADVLLVYTEVKNGGETSYAPDSHIFRAGSEVSSTQ